AWSSARRAPGAFSMSAGHPDVPAQRPRRQGRGAARRGAARLHARPRSRDWTEVTMSPGLRIPNPLRQISVILVAFLAVVVYGTVGYMVIEHWAFLDALFMTVITITTVGFEEVHRLDGPGQIFTITVIVLGVAGFLYTFGLIIELLSLNRWQS